MERMPQAMIRLAVIGFGNRMRHLMATIDRFSAGTRLVAVVDPLVMEGLLTRTQGRGAFVARPRLRQSLSRLTSFSEDMRDRGLLGTTRLLAREEMPASPEI